MTNYYNIIEDSYHNINTNSNISCYYNFFLSKICDVVNIICIFEIVYYYNIIVTICSHLNYNCYYHTCYAG